MFGAVGREDLKEIVERHMDLVAFEMTFAFQPAHTAASHLALHAARHPWG